jgi:hypothetical protein
MGELVFLYPKSLDKRGFEAAGVVAVCGDLLQLSGHKPAGFGE